MEITLTTRNGYRRISPSSVKALGHFGFFRERFRDSLWRETADWLERQ